MLVVSPGDFNEATRLPVILPITSGGAFARRIGFAVEIEGIDTTGIVRCDQPRAIDMAARGGKKVEELPQAILDEAMARLSTIFA